MVALGLAFFIISAVLGYSSLSEFGRSYAGKAVSYSGRAASSAIVASSPDWLYLSMIGVAIYIWWKHKLVMSIVYGVIFGLFLAFG